MLLAKTSSCLAPAKRNDRRQLDIELDGRVYHATLKGYPAMPDAAAAREFDWTRI